MSLVIQGEETLCLYKLGSRTPCHFFFIKHTKLWIYWGSRWKKREALFLPNLLIKKNLDSSVKFQSTYVMKGNVCFIWERGTALREQTKLNGNKRVSLLAATKFLPQNLQSAQHGLHASAGSTCSTAGWLPAGP